MSREACRRSILPSSRAKNPGDVLWLEDTFCGGPMYGVACYAEGNFCTLVLRVDGSFALIFYEKDGTIAEEVVPIRYDGPRDDLVPANVTLREGKTYISLPWGNGMTLDDGTVVGDAQGPGGTLVVVGNKGRTRASKIFTDLVAGSVAITAMDNGFALSGRTMVGETFLAKMDNAVDCVWSIGTSGVITISEIIHISGELLVVGTFSGPAKFGDRELCALCPTPWIGRVSCSGDVVWVRTLAVVGTGESVAVNGGIYVAGTLGTTGNIHKVYIAKMGPEGSTETMTTFTTRMVGVYDTFPRLSIIAGGVALSFYSFGGIYQEREDGERAISKGTGLTDMVIVGFGAASFGKIGWMSIVVGVIPNPSRGMASDGFNLYLLGTHLVSSGETSVLTARLAV